MTGKAMAAAAVLLQNPEVQRRLRAAAAEGVDRLKTWNAEHGGVTGVAPDLTSITRRASRQGRLEARVERLQAALDALRTTGGKGTRLDWLAQSLDEASTTLTISAALPREKRRPAHAAVESLLGDIEDVLATAGLPSGDIDR